MKYWDDFQPIPEPWTLLVWENLFAIRRRAVRKGQRWVTSPTLQQIWRLPHERLGIITFLGQHHAEWIEHRWEPLDTIPLNEVFYADETHLQKTIATDHWIRYLFDPDPNRATLAWGGKGHYIDPVSWSVT